jgi:peroxiredoxin Q/BCP
MPKLGQKAPAFSLPSTSGATVSLGDFAGKQVVLYFYPRDNTPGCTVEACDFRDRDAALRQAGAVVLGVSSDSLKSHEGFRSKHKLSFDLLVDADNAVAKAYGAHGEKLMYGKKVVGTIRSTFLIDASGRIAAVWSPVKVAGHAEEVLSAVRGSQGADPKAAPAGPVRQARRAAGTRAAKSPKKAASAKVPATASARAKTKAKAKAPRRATAAGKVGVPSKSSKPAGARRR